ncbi:hypothetical protein BHM03_00014741 [Ensete ventricosum]|uniref:Uncharacterized protein n=1 Tax=Ensete ventricosum TaxID=4639 RepID=A0A445MEB4_ENSVE|nr:hypothetical protein BHM03_00014741 [Ensete ventricosum]
MVVDFGGDVSLAEKEQTIMLEPKVPDLDIKTRRTHEKKRGRWQRGDLDGGKRRSGGYSKRSRGCFGSVALRKKTLAMSKER